MSGEEEEYLGSLGIFSAIKVGSISIKRLQELELREVFEDFGFKAVVVLQILGDRLGYLELDSEDLPNFRFYLFRPRIRQSRKRVRNLFHLYRDVGKL